MLLYALVYLCSRDCQRLKIDYAAAPGYLVILDTQGRLRFANKHWKGRPFSVQSLKELLQEVDALPVLPANFKMTH